MNAVRAIPEAELREDLYACLLDAKACDKVGMTDRAEGNRRIIQVIVTEMKRRDLDVPPGAEAIWTQYS